MKEKINNIFLNVFVLIIIILWFGCFCISLVRLNKMSGEYKQQDEQIKILEQSLSEQITEKEVYMKMLEEKGEE